MWPWEHVIVGYLLYSASVRARRSRPPGEGATLAVAVGALFPDLVDKPLAWSFALLPSGRSLAHSLLVAVPVAAAVWVTARRAGRPAVGAAFGAGYLAHLPADVLYPLFLGNEPTFGFLLWPLVPVEPATGDYGLGRVLVYASDFAAFVASSEGWRFLLVEGVLVALFFWRWIADGKPGLAAARRLVRAGRRS